MALQLTAARARSPVFDRCLRSALAATERQPVGRVLGARLSRSRTALSVFLAYQSSTVTRERIERGMNARYAAWFRSRFSQPRVVRVPVMLPWFRSTPGPHQRDSNARYAALFRVALSQPCVG
jgi:hypothetical protein